MNYNTPDKKDFSTIDTKFEFDRNVSPVWAKLLYKGVKDRGKVSKNIETVKDDPSLIFKGLLGKSLLDKHINPFFDKMLPDSTKLDVLKQQLKFKPHDRFDMTVGKNKLGLNWRF